MVRCDETAESEEREEAAALRAELAARRQSRKALVDRERRERALDGQLSTNGFVLVLRSISWSRQSSFLIGVGEVKNISADPLENVLVNAMLYDNSGDLVGADKVLVEFRPIPPGESSPFKIMTRYRPNVRDASVRFTTFDGTLLKHTQYPSTPSSAADAGTDADLRQPQ